MNRCDTCKHLHTESYSWGPWRTCWAMNHPTPGQPASVTSEEDGAGQQLVVHDPTAFGCTLHEPTETA